MSYEFFIAKRYIRSKKAASFLSFITYVAVVGVMLGTAALIIALSILGGFEKEIKDKVVGFMAYIQVQGFETIPLTNYEEAMKIVKANVKEITAISPYVGKEAMIRSAHGIDGAYVKGIDSDLDVSSTRRQMVTGRFYLGESEGLPSIVLGKRLSDKLIVDVGDKVTVFGITGMPSPLNMPRVMQFRVTGVYETGMSEYDDVFAYTSIPIAQQLFRYGNAITGFNIMVDDPDKAQTIATEIQRLLGYPYYPRTIFQMYRNLFTWIELQKKPIPIVLGLIIIVATFNVIGTLLMVVMEKTREIGVLKSMGATSKGIMRIFVVEGLFIGIVGTTLGNLLAYCLCWLQLNYKILSLPEGIYYMNTVPILMQMDMFLLVSGIAVTLCFLATLVPSFLGSKLNPINAIRFG